MKKWNVSSSAFTVIVAIVLFFTGCMTELDDHQDDEDLGIPTGNVSTIAGTGEGGFNGDNIQASTAQLNSPFGVTARASGEIIIADSLNNRVRSVDPDTGVITSLAGTGLPTGDGALFQPVEILFDEDGGFYVAAWGEHRIFRYSTSAERELIAGSGLSGCNLGENVPVADSTISFPRSFGILGDGSLIFTEQGCHRLRQILDSGNIVTFAGTGEPGYSGDDGLALNAQFRSTLDSPVAPAFGMSVSPEEIPDELYVADTENHVIREINLRNGNIETIAGTGRPGFADGPRNQATFNRPTKVFVSSDHAVWVVDAGNHAIRRIDSLGTSVETVAGTGTAGFNGDNLPPLQTQLNLPTDVFVTSTGDVLISDSGNNRIRLITSDR